MHALFPSSSLSLISQYFELVNGISWIMLSLLTWCVCSAELFEQEMKETDWCELQEFMKNLFDEIITLANNDNFLN